MYDRVVQRFVRSFASRSPAAGRSASLQDIPVQTCTCTTTEFTLQQLESKINTIEERHKQHYNDLYKSQQRQDDATQDQLKTLLHKYIELEANVTRVYYMSIVGVQLGASVAVILSMMR